MEASSARPLRLAFAIAVVLVCATATAASAAVPSVARTTGGSPSGLGGTWTGTLSGVTNGKIHRERILIVVNTRQSGGRWKLSPTCHGPLTLDSISGGYHHYRRRAASGASCLGGTIDCLMRMGANVYDSVTPRPGGYALTGTLRRVPNQ